LSVVVTDITEGPVYLLGADPNRTGEPDGIASTLTVGTAATVATVEPVGVAPAGAVGTPQLNASVSLTGISSGVAFGTLVLAGEINALPDGFADTGAVGTPSTTVDIELTGIPGAATVGTATAFNSIFPQGIDAGTGAVGTPSTTASMQPTGVASGVQFGDTDIIATVFVIPGPVDPSNDFGNPIVLQKRLIFRPPTQTLGWGWYKRFEGISVIKKDGVWEEIPWPTVQETLEADIYLAGGRDHAVSTTLAAELIGEGYTISEEY
jgi:hypothetical protein